MHVHVLAANHKEIHPFRGFSTTPLLGHLEVKTA